MNAQSQAFASLLRWHRLAEGLSQEELAERAGLSRRGVSDLERGIKRSPHRDTILRLADALRLEGQERALFVALAHGQRSQKSRDDTHSSSALPHHTALFVGRQREIALLDEHRAGKTPPMLFVAGEPGIGKSRLLVETGSRATAQGWRVVSGGCGRRSGQEPYEPFVSTLARELRHTPPARQRMDLQGCSWLVRLLPELLEARIAPAPMWSLPPEQERRLMIGAVGRYLANVAGPSGTLLVLDDLQWAGEDALALLATLLDGMTDSTSPALRIVGAYRDTEALPADPLGLLVADLVGAARATRVWLSPLTRDEALILLDEVWREMPGDAPASMPGVLQGEILRRADGLPFYIVSSARAMQSAEHDDEGNIKEPIPSSVTGSIRARLAVLPQVARELLGVAAVGGRVIAGGLLMAVTPHQEDEVLDALDRLRLAGLLIETEEDSYRFTHDLIREVVETDLGARRRRILHRRMALALERYAAHERTSQAADLAYHFSEAGDIGEALPYALMAGDQAEAAFAHTEASAHFHAAIRYAEATGDLPRKAEALEKLGATLLCFGQTDPALVALDEATKLYDELDDDEGRYRSLALIVETHWQRGTAQEFLKHLGPNLGAEQRQESASPSPGLAALYKSICGAHRYDGQYEELANAARHLERLAHELHDDSLLLTARYHQAYVACSLSTEAPIPTAFLDLVPLAERIGDSVTLLTLQNDISAEYLFSGQFSLADTYIKRAVQQAQQFGSPHHITKMLINRAELHYCRGAWADARADSLQVEAIAKESDQFGITYSLLYRLILRGMLAMAEGCEEVARELLTHVRQLSNGNHDLHALAYSSHLLAESDLLAGRAAETCVYLMPVLDELHDIPEFANYVYPFAAWALLGSGRKQEAFSVVESGIASMRARNRNLFLTQALRVRAMVAIQSNRWAAAKADLDEAIMLAEAMPYPYAALKALWVYGQLEAARGDLVAARTRYDEALAICDRLGEGLYRKHIERDLATLR